VTLEIKVNYLRGVNRETGPLGFRKPGRRAQMSETGQEA
jgi:hypothetical protein